jgi:DNA-binding MarR family transcriptional regulator
MTFTKVIMDLDQVMIKDLGDFARDDLEQTIKSLEQKGLIKRSVIDKETSWIRLHLRKPWWRRLFSL